MKSVDKIQICCNNDKEKIIVYCRSCWTIFKLCLDCSRELTDGFGHSTCKICKNIM